MSGNLRNIWVKDPHDSFAKRWVEYWQTPARPTPQEIEFLRNYMRTLQKGNQQLAVMILGSTTEYRDLMFELHSKPTVVDLSKENYEILSKRLTYYNNYKNREVLVVQKWQSMDIDKKFDIVLGHFALSINPFDTWNDILRSIYHHLADGGLFITNNWVTGDSAVSIDDIIKEYNTTWRGKHSLLGSMMPKIYVAARDNMTGETPYSSIRNIIEAVYASGRISDEDYSEYKNCGYPDFNCSLFIPSEEQFCHYIEKYFIIQDKVILNPYPNAYLMPEWVLKKRPS